MTTYVDTSALLKRYVEEPDSTRAEALLLADPVLATGRHTVVEVRRNLARLLSGSGLTSARQAFTRELSSFVIVELDDRTCALAAALAEQTGLRTLEALHLGAARRLGSPQLLTFDVRQAAVARDVGLVVVGA